MIFTDYWKGLVLNLSTTENAVFFLAKELMERWYIQITEKFLFSTFWWWEMWSLFQPKSLWKDDIYSVYLSFPWYSRTCEIWVFVQRLSFFLQKHWLWVSSKWLTLRLWIAWRRLEGGFQWLNVDIEKDLLCKSYRFFFLTLVAFSHLRLVSVPCLLFTVVSMWHHNCSSFFN